MDFSREDIQTHLDNRILKLISQVADEMQVECYVIGGYVRDFFLYRPSKDIDVVAVGSGVALAENVARKLGRTASVSVFKNFGTAQLKYKDFEVEFVGARKESYNRDSRKPVVENGTLEDDQRRRDFTINAMAFCLNVNRFGELVDPFGGIQDLEKLIIRTPLDPDITFSDDPLRMMRALRFASQLGFDIYPETFEAVARNRERIGIVSAERVIDELNKIILSPKPSVGFVLLEKTGLLDLIFPELTALKGAETKDGVGHKDNFFHTLAVLDNISRNTDNLWLRWAALLHDIGKPTAKRWDPKLGWTFHNHDFIGEKMVLKIFKRMKLPLNEKMRYVHKLVGLHMRPMQLVEEVVTDSAIRRLLFDTGDDIDDLMTLCEADITSKNPEKVRRFLNNFKIVRRKLKDIEEKDRVRNFQPPVDGNEIMQVFGLGQGRKVGLLKTAIKDAILDGEIPNEHDAAYRFLLEKAAAMGLKPMNGLPCKLSVDTPTN
ncbi:MAG: CCA tRNA nucleotidyltransferase [Dysgonamonadaceae bacterium]|jgi:poly(A) polymerase|nr:CCA tRNA nucleotidyltransferase [Dysgonamonadaceae bacterium]